MKKVFIEDIEVKEEHIGKQVIFDDGFSKPEKGVISSFEDGKIWVKFGKSSSGQRCHSSNLKWS